CRTAPLVASTLVLALGLAAPSGGCAKSVAPERVALEYARAVFASDASAIYRLVSDDDRRARDETTFRGQQAEPRGFAREGVHLHFAATVDRSVPLEVSVAPSDVTVNPGDRVRVTVHARNRTSHDVTTRVGHRIEPAAQSQHLALVQCPLFVPITLRGGETR